MGTEEADMKKTLLRRKLDFIAKDTETKVQKLFRRNRAAGLRPNCWKDIDDPDDFNTVLETCPELDSIYADGMNKEFDELYDAAWMMTADEWEYILNTDKDLVESLLGGPQRMFVFPLDAACKNEVKRLYKLLWGHDELLLRRKLNSLREAADTKTEALFVKNRKLGIKPSRWGDIDHNNAADLLNNSIEFYDAVVPGCLTEIAMLNEAAELMSEDEFKEILVCDADLTNKLLNGPQEKFTFTLDGECQKRVQILRNRREAE